MALAAEITATVIDKAGAAAAAVLLQVSKSAAVFETVDSAVQDVWPKQRRQWWSLALLPRSLPS